MGTKNNPAPFDCYAAAEPDEPMFVLLGRDPLAGILVRLWAAAREAMKEDPAKVAEARACADAMILWAGEKKTRPVVEGSWKVLHDEMERALEEWDASHPAPVAEPGEAAETVLNFLRDGLNGLMMRKGAELGAKMKKAVDAQACPKCDAPIGEWCKNEDGKAFVHKERMPVLIASTTKH